MLLCPSRISIWLDTTLDLLPAEHFAQMGPLLTEHLLLLTLYLLEVESS
jgi:hypothetical protein